MTASTPVERSAVRAATTAFRAQRRELEFFLWELKRVHETQCGVAPFPELTRAQADALLDEAFAFAARLGESYQASDREGCRLEDDGSVTLPAAYAELWPEYVRDWVRFQRHAEALRPGQLPAGLPTTLMQVILELFMGANPSFMTYGGFCAPAAKLIARHGTPHQKALLLDRIRSYEWDACFCATEKDAGSDITAVRTLGLEQPDGSYDIRGEKVYISAAMHQLTPNTVYFVLGRSDDKTADSFAMSCFLVPKYWVEEDGTLVDNHVRCIKVEDKMGLRGCANTHLVFGSGGRTRGMLLGDRKNVGLLQFAPLMSEARMGTGLFGLGLASAAYLHSLEFARNRVQGRRIENAVATAAPRVAIIEHADVQRMLLEMRSKVEGCRGLLGKLTRCAAELHTGRAAGLPADTLARTERLLKLYTPLVKAYISDQAWRVCELAIQVHGGIGYIRDLPIEQYARDVKILSIWEGTNYIQAQDLVREKLAFGRDPVVMDQLGEDLRAFLAGVPAGLRAEAEAVDAAFAAVKWTLGAIGDWVRDRELQRVAQHATRFLEMLAQVVVAWSLLEAAAVASQALQAPALADDEREFYTGKLATARYFIHNCLPGVHTDALVMRNAASFVPVASASFGQSASASA